MPCTILTPHMADWKKALRNLFDNIEPVARGESRLWVVREVRNYAVEDERNPASIAGSWTTSGWEGAKSERPNRD